MQLSAELQTVSPISPSRGTFLNTGAREWRLHPAGSRSVWVADFKEDPRVGDMVATVGSATTIDHDPETPALRIQERYNHALT